MAPVISSRATTARPTPTQVGRRVVANRPSANTRNIRAFGFFDDLKKAASSVTDKLQGAAKEVEKAADNAGAATKDAASDVADTVESAADKAAAEAKKAAEAVKDAAEK